MFHLLRSAALPLLGLGLSTVSTLSTMSGPLRAEPQKAAAAPAAPTAPAPAPELSAAQRQQFEALRDKTERQLAPLREQLGARRKELSALWSAEPPNRAAILQKESEVAALRQKVRQVLIEQRLSQLALLTSAQRANWRSHHGGGGKMGAMEMGNMHGGMGAMHAGGSGMKSMDMDDCLDCMDCMHCEGSGTCLTTPAPATAPAAPH